jgi:hypothetical protein
MKAPGFARDPAVNDQLERINFKGTVALRKLEN